MRLVLHFLTRQMPQAHWRAFFFYTHWRPIGPSITELIISFFYKKEREKEKDLFIVLLLFFILTHK